MNFLINFDIKQEGQKKKSQFVARDDLQLFEAYDKDSIFNTL